MVTTMTTSSDCVAVAGTNANSTITTSDGRLTTWINQAESFINCATRYNYTDTYATLNADVKAILSETCECLVANKIIGYDMSGYTSRIEAETMMDLNLDTALRGVSILRDKKTITFINGS